MTTFPNEDFRRMVPLLREKRFYESVEPRTISWPHYSSSLIEEATETLDFIRDAVDAVALVPSPGKVGKPLTCPRDLAKAVLLSEAFSFTERGAQGWARILGPCVGIVSRLDDRTIGDAYGRLEVLLILKEVFVATKGSNGTLSGDGTGLETSRKQNYESTKKAGEYMTSIIDSREIVQAFDVSGEQECRVMHKLLERVYGDSLRLDAGFNDRELVRKIAEKGMVPFVFPRKDNNLNGSVAWYSMYLSLFIDVMQWLTEYHQRSHCESFHSSFKSKYGIITKRRNTSRLSQITARIILHNRRRLSYFKRLSG